MIIIYTFHRRYCHIVKVSFYSQYLFSIHNILLCYKEYFTIRTIEQDQAILLNHCIRPRALLSFTNNNPFYIKRLLHSQNNSCTVETIGIRVDLILLNYSLSSLPWLSHSQTLKEDSSEAIYQNLQNPSIISNFQSSSI